ncbi:MAG: tyrosine-type recombinase/integrase [Solirubrobacterales bacterium]
MRAMILFAAYVGLRPAEMFVLRRADLDFAQGLVRIHQSLGATGEITAPKNGKARTVVLPPPAADALRALQSRPDSPYLFTTSKGTRFTKTTHYYHWRQARLAAGRPGMDFYELRHFCATRLLELGVSPPHPVPTGHRFRHGGVRCRQQGRTGCRRARRARARATTAPDAQP